MAALPVAVVAGEAVGEAVPGKMGSIETPEQITAIAQANSLMRSVAPTGSERPVVDDEAQNNPESQPSSIGVWACKKRWEGEDIAQIANLVIEEQVSQKSGSKNFSKAVTAIASRYKVSARRIKQAILRESDRILRK